MSDTSPVAEATPETAVDTGLPYNHAVPGAVLARWAEETDPALIVAADKIIDLLTYLRDEEKYDFLSSVTCVDYLTYKGKLRKGISRALRCGLPSLQHQQGRRPYCAPCPGGQERHHRLGDGCLPWGQLAGARDLRPLRHQVYGPPQPAPYSAVGWFQRPPHAQGLERGLFRRG